MIYDVVKNLNVISVRARIPATLLCSSALLNEPASNESTGCACNLCITPGGTLIAEPVLLELLISLRELLTE